MLRLQKLFVHILIWASLFIFLLFVGGTFSVCYFISCESKTSVDLKTSTNATSPNETVQMTEKESLLLEKPEVTCKDWIFFKSESKNRKPRIPLDSNRFLYPGLWGGPNNQIVGLKKSIYLAIRINRTLVIPKFHSHWTHPGVLLPHQIIDVNLLCEFVSCISIEQLKEKCDSSFDIAFQTIATSIASVKALEEDTEMVVRFPKRVMNITNSRKLWLQNGKTKSIIPVLPNINITNTYGSVIPSSSNILNKAFNSSAKCAIIIDSFHSINIYPYKNMAIPLDENVSEMRDVPDQLLYSAVTNMVQHSPSIVKAANNYIRDVLKNQRYIAIHWRYDTNDWIKRICNSSVHFVLDWSKYVCDNIRNVQPTDVARAVAKSFFEDIRRQNLTLSNVPVYIATPPTLEDFRRKLIHHLYDTNKRIQEPPQNLTSYLHHNHHECLKENNWNVAETISLIEMELMVHSSWFFYSSKSSWSSNAGAHRTFYNNGKIEKRFERDVFALGVEGQS